MTLLLITAALLQTSDHVEKVLRLEAAAPFVDVILAGQPVRLRVDFAAHGGVTLNPEEAKRLRLNRTGRMLMSIGPVNGESPSGRTTCAWRLSKVWLTSTVQGTVMRVFMKSNMALTLPLRCWRATRTDAV